MPSDVATASLGCPHGARRPAPLYGLDIETDTTVDGLDPRVGRVLAVAVAQADGVTVLDDSCEAELLAGLERHLAGLDPGVLVTWNGARFDLPYLSTRAARGEVALGLRLEADATRVHRADPADPAPVGSSRAIAPAGAGTATSTSTAATAPTSARRCA